MIMDGSKAQTSRSSAFIARLRRNKVMQIVANPYRPNMNPCEVAIQELRTVVYDNISHKLSPSSVELWVATFR